MQPSSSSSKRKSAVTFAINDEPREHTRPRVKMQRRNSKVGRMFFTDMKQARKELRKESTSISNFAQSNVPLDQLFSPKESNGVYRLRQLGLGESLFDDALLKQSNQIAWSPTEKNEDPLVPYPLSATDPSIEEIIFAHAFRES